MIMIPTTSMTMTPMSTTTTTTTTMVMMMMTIATSIKALAVSHDASPLGWSQNWSHPFASVVNHSETSTSEALLGLLWAQGVAGPPAGASAKAGSNPVAPTTFRVPLRGSTGRPMSSIRPLSLEFR
jgi:hypothetical protein